MADNYLENKYAEYQARKTSGTRTGHTTKTLHKTRRVFITGGAEGIGKAIVRAFRGAGHRVAFCDKNETLGKETALQTGTQFHLVDVSDKTALEDCLRKIIEEWGDIDIIINNAGVSQFSPITETSVEDFDKILSINLRPAFITSRQLALHRQSLDAQNPYGRIINICSTRYLMSEPGSEGTLSLPVGYRITITTSFVRRIMLNIHPDGWASRRISPVCAYFSVKRKTISLMARILRLTVG